MANSTVYTTPDPNVNAPYGWIQTSAGFIPKGPPGTNGVYDTDTSVIDPNQPTHSDPMVPDPNQPLVPNGQPGSGLNTQITPNVPTGPNQIGVVDYAGQVVTDPSLLIGPDMQLANKVPVVTQGNIDSGIQPMQGELNPAGVKFGAATGQTTDATAATQGATATTTAAQTAGQVAASQGTAAQGTLSAGAQIDPNAVLADLTATGAGTNPAGEALKQSAQQNMTNIIDTTTLAGKLVAEQLGNGNYTDSKATLKGQLDILQGEFFDANGEPKIPSWAAGTARNVSKIAAFKGMTGTAATAAMAQALMEASLPIAQEDAKFFQTLTLENLSNRQEQTINRANVLAKLDLANMDSRLAVAVNNSQSFLKMDLSNLDNEQQTSIINTQARIQSILEDGKAENTARLFNAQSKNEMDMYYDNLETSISEFNASQKNAMSQYNAGEINDTSQFNAEMENNREQFYKNMQFAVDTANSKWRQTLTLTTNAQQFEAAATDVKNMVGVSVEQLNQLWDRSDALLDYIWKTADNTAERNNRIAVAKLTGEMALDAADKEGTGAILGTLIGTGLPLIFDWLM